MDDSDGIVVAGIFKAGTIVCHDTHRYAGRATPEEGAWPTRDNPLGEQRQRDPAPIGPRVEVTAEMLKAAHVATVVSGYMPISNEAQTIVYRAMHAAAPVELCPEDRIAALERDLAWITERMKSWANSAGSWAAENADLRLELSRLHDLLAQRPAPVPDTPKPAHNPFRDHAKDRRMLGP